MLLKIPSSSTLSSDDDMPGSGGGGGGAINDMLDFYEADLDAQGGLLFVDELTGAGYVDVDFDEYLWMMDEEEFDKQEMQRLEEEELIEECLGAMIGEIAFDEDDDDLDDYGEDDENAYGPCVPDDDDDDKTPVASEEDDASLESCKALSRLVVSAESKLNPHAEEFVPAPAEVAEPLIATAASS